MFTWNIPVRFDQQEINDLVASFLPANQAGLDLTEFIYSPGYGRGDNQDDQHVGFQKFMQGQKLAFLSKASREVVEDIYARSWSPTRILIGFRQNKHIVDAIIEEMKRDSSINNLSLDAMLGVAFGYPTRNIIEFLMKTIINECLSEYTDTNAFLQDFPNRVAAVPAGFQARPMDEIYQHLVALEIPLQDTENGIRIEIPDIVLKDCYLAAYDHMKERTEEGNL